MIDTDIAPTKATILVLEDDLDLRYVLSDSLRDEGYRVIEASSADDAQNHLRAFNDVDLVIADIKFPGELDGFGLAQAIHQEFPAIKVILTSGYLKEAIPEGMLFLRKPYILSRMIAEVYAMLQTAKTGKP